MSFIADKNIDSRKYRHEMEAYRDPFTVRLKQRIDAHYGRVKEEKGKPTLKPKQSIKPKVEEIILYSDLDLIYNTALKLDFVRTVDRMVWKICTQVLDQGAKGGIDWR